VNDTATLPEYETVPPALTHRACSSSKANDQHATGALIINADDWGRDDSTTRKIAECARVGAISSVSAMVFMAGTDSAAEIASEASLDVGLHLNFTTPFDGHSCPRGLAERQRTVGAYLRGHRFAQAVYHPGLANDFTYAVRAQLEEFEKLYGVPPRRLDGHHHMHLCANVLLGGLLPTGTIVRRNFSFVPGEKSAVNRLYRRLVDNALARHHRLTDFFFSLSPIEPRERLGRIFALARHAVVEVETHPVRRDEYTLLLGSAKGPAR